MIRAKNEIKQAEEIQRIGHRDSEELPLRRRDLKNQKAPGKAFQTRSARAKLRGRKEVGVLCSANREKAVRWSESQWGGGPGQGEGGL